MLFHISEEVGIRRFEPRATEVVSYPVVWAIDEPHIRNYLLPRDCPRVTYYRTPTSTQDDVDAFLGAVPAVVAVETAWLARIHESTLQRYQLPDSAFECLDPGAGYFVSKTAVVPEGVTTVRALPQAIRATGADFRALDNLWPLHDAVARSTLQFSMIRMRNASPRPR